MRIHTKMKPRRCDQFIQVLQKLKQIPPWRRSSNRLQWFYKFGVDNISKRRVSFFIKFCDSFIFMGQGGWPFDEIGEFTVPYNCRIVSYHYLLFYTVYLPVRTQHGSWYVFCSRTCLYNI